MCVMKVPNIDALREEVLARKGQWAALARVGDLDYSWVVRFARGDIAVGFIVAVLALGHSLDRLPIEARPQ